MLTTRNEFLSALDNFPSATAAGRALNVPEATARRWARSAITQPVQARKASYIETPAIPPRERSIDEILGARRKEFERIDAHRQAVKLIPIAVKTPGPIGLLNFGDPHLDDPGTDIKAIERDRNLVLGTDGLFAGNVGDMTNNWVGRLARLYSEQSTTQSEAWQLVDWFVGSLEWLYFIVGNHDVWNQGVEIIARLRALAVTTPTLAARLGLKFPNGREIRVNARHDFRGNSQWNAAHGVMKAAQLGEYDHLFVAGHTHVSGYGIVKAPQSGTVAHCLQLASYKVHDRFAEEMGFRDQHISPSALTIFDPDAKTEVGLVQVFHDTEWGADVLAYKRRKARV